ncbi:sigma 54-interacting transcriptional regulator [Sporosarcina sp. ACRSL]|uniref:sigma-54 interaction domain-containing protein n=1 Tax=Sporosarcina sp. ACRSL TaxID=2918215 RepID=UPI001EF704C5|nr:sigma 54-interacting transcriptional regulator [Sporosarcina sp. ACRSL]MCG7345665.1 sigma 54-interacting transcriptional regulator [Sporosarcina sp. ACRSL]
MNAVTDRLTESVLLEILENAFQWFVVVDKETNILYINEEYCKFLETTREEAIGKPVNEVIENTRMHEVVESGEVHIASPHFIKGTYMLANRVPLRVDGEIVGAFGSVIFRDLNDWHNLSSHVKTTMEKIKIGQETEKTIFQLQDILGSSDAIKSVKETIQMIAPSDLPILIQGESGTGKEMFAQSIHYRSNRSEKPFVKVNCALIPVEFLELELFGSVGPTGQIQRKGRFHQAEGGTLFFEDLGDMPLAMQVKLLRALQEGTIEPIGSHKASKVNVRIIAAVNQPLKTLMESGKLREDLYYRVHAITLHIPPLRQRMDDFEEIANHFFYDTIAKVGKRNLSIAPETMQYLKEYSWPGNVRELQNVIQAAVYLTNGDVILPSVLPQEVRIKSRYYSNHAQTLQEAVEQLERNLISETLQIYPNRREAAKVLGLSRSTFYEKLKKYGF